MLVDVLVVAWVGVFALAGFFRGFTAQIVSLAGLVAGTVAGAWIAPRVLGGDEESQWVPLASLSGAALGALVLGLAAGPLAARARRFLAARPPLGVLDEAGGVVVGAALGVGLAWLAAVLFLHQPTLGLRRAVQGSALLPALVRTFPPEPVLRAVDRFDPLPLLPGLPGGDLPALDASILRSAGTRAAAASVVKVEGTSCGLGVQGSGWVVRRALVATNAHVIAGQTDTRVVAPNGQELAADVVYVDGDNDVALLRVRSLAPRPLRTGPERSLPEAVALLGYPHDGPLTASAGAAGERTRVLAPDAYGRGVRRRVVVPLRGRVEQGESGGAVVDRRGRVLAMVFGGTKRREGGFAVPVELVLRGVSRTARPVDPGPCLG